VEREPRFGRVVAGTIIQIFAKEGVLKTFGVKSWLKAI
jgi:hypothetical protein